VEDKGGRIMDFEYLAYRLFLIFCSIKNKIKGIFAKKEYE